MGRGTGAKESRADYRPCMVWVQLRRVELGAGYTSRVPLNGVEESEETKLYAYAAMLYDAMCQVTSFANQAWRLERSGLDSSRHVASCHSGIACTTLPTSPFIKRTPHQDQCLRSIPISHTNVNPDNLFARGGARPQTWATDHPCTPHPFVACVRQARGVCSGLRDLRHAQRVPASPGFTTTASPW